MFFLYFDRSGTKENHGIHSRDIIKKLNPFSTPDKSGHLKKKGVLFVQSVNWNTAASILEPAPFVHPLTGITIASWARIDNRVELAGKLDIARPDLEQICDSELILKSYLKWKENCVDHLIGDFVFVLFDEKKQKIFCGRDHMGVRPFYYFISDNLFVCATGLSALMQIQGLPVKVRTQWMVEYLSLLSMSFDRTPYEGIYKLPPAHTLSVTRNNHSLRRYFKLSATPELKLKDSREYVEAYKEQLETAIKCRLNTTYPLGTELSGGLDSSTITAFGAKFFDQPITNFHTFAFANLALEPQYIMTVSQKYGLPYNHIFAGRQHVKESIVDRSLKILGYPVEHNCATFHESFYEMAEKFDTRTLLSGFGGDEFSTTNHGYMVPLELIMKHQYKALYQRLAGNPFFRFLRLVKLGVRRIKSSNFTLPEYNPRFYEAYSKRWPHQIVRRELVEKYKIKQRYFDQARFDAGYTDLKKFILENRWAPFVPTRMENCTLMAGARKIEYRWPLLDIRLVRLFLSIPSKENYFRGMGRYLHRRAINGIVPDLVAWKPGKNMGKIIGFDFQTSENLKQTAVYGLHPDLKKLINIKKFCKQFKAKNKKLTDSSFQIRRNQIAVKNMNNWLHLMSSLAPYK
jgi:asparagine synthase (glutamine-hydrolysing)